MTALVDTACQINWERLVVWEVGDRERIKTCTQERAREKNKRKDEEEKDYRGWLLKSLKTRENREGKRKVEEGKMYKENRMEK